MLETSNLYHLKCYIPSIVTGQQMVGGGVVGMKRMKEWVYDFPGNLHLNEHQIL
jgi:hypothetical protein